MKKHQTIIHSLFTMKKDIILDDQTLFSFLKYGTHITERMWKPISIAGSTKILEK